MGRVGFLFDNGDATNRSVGMTRAGRKRVWWQMEAPCPFSLRVASADELPKERDESSWTFGAKGMSR